MTRRALSDASSEDDVNAAMPNPAGCGTAPMMQVEGLSKSFGKIEALNDIGLQIVSGEVHARHRREWCGQIDTHEDPVRGTR
jgi:hypothetical protein